MRARAVVERRGVVGLWVCRIVFALSPTATDIKAWGAMSEAIGTLGMGRQVLTSLKGTNNYATLFDAFSVGMFTKP